MNVAADPLVCLVVDLLMLRVLVTKLRNGLVGPETVRIDELHRVVHMLPDRLPVLPGVSHRRGSGFTPHVESESRGEGEANGRSERAKKSSNPVGSIRRFNSCSSLTKAQSLALT